MDTANLQGVVLLLVVVAIMLLVRRRQWRGSTSACGTARFCDDANLAAAAMFEGVGLVLGRSLTSGRLIFLPDYCHLLLVGATGAGKGVSVIIPLLLSYFCGSCVVFDCKGDLFATTAARRAARGQRIIRLSPFGGGTDAFNPLDCIGPGPMLVDHARALAEALVLRQNNEVDPHWSESAVVVITGILVCVLLFFRKEERNLNSVREIASDPLLLDEAAQQLRKAGGIPARFGNHILGMEGKERSGVMSTVGRHLAFLDTELVAASLASSTFLPGDLLRAGTTLYLQIPPDQLEAQKGLLRCWIATLVREIGRAGSESESEVLFLIDEASALGSLSALEEVLVRGRSAGCRVLLAYQSDSQVQAAFPEKPTLIFDNCSCHLYLGANSYETAERISKRLGEATITVEAGSENDSTSWQQGGYDQTGGVNASQGYGKSWSVQARPLMKPEEVLTTSGDHLFVFLRAMPPLLCRRLRWYADPAFRDGADPGGSPDPQAPPLWWWLVCLAGMTLFCAMLAGR